MSMLHTIMTTVILNPNFRLAAQVHVGNRLPSIWCRLFPIGLMDELVEHPFLKLCESGELDYDLLKDFLIQHQYYSQYFTRYLCAMMASLPVQADVKALAYNLFEEMGFGGGVEITHAELYLQSMAAAGAVAKSKPIFPATQKLIDVMFQHCRSIDPLDGLAALCLGAEAIVPIVYGAVLSGMRHLGIAAEGLKFFEIHVFEDEKHALVMRGIIDQLLSERPEQLSKVHTIGSQMVRLRMALFDDLLMQGQR